jgi:PAS domain S-box-containing protein
MKGWRKQQAESTPAGVARAVLAGASRRELLQEAAAFLLAHGETDRVGVWAESKEPPATDGGTFRGLVLNRNGEEAPAEWQRLSPEAPLPAALLTAGKTVEQDLDGSPGGPILGALMDIRHAVWVPVESQGRLRGVLMVGVRKRAGTLPRAMVELVAAELALAFELEEERRSANDYHNDLVLTKKWLAALAKLGPTDSVLTSLVENCTVKSVASGGLGAVFAVLRAWEDSEAMHAVPSAGGSAGLRQDSSVSLKDAINSTGTVRCWSSGDETWVRAIENEPIDERWRRTREAHSPVGTEPGSRRLSSDFVRTVSIHLESNGQRLGTFAAGFPHSAFSPQTFERLEVRAALASTALSLRERNAEMAQQINQQQTLLQATMGATLLVDANGGIYALSRGARQLLSAVVPVDGAAANTEPGIAAIRFPELFRARDQQRVQQWLQQSMESRAANGLDGEPVDAELDSGARVRLRWYGAPAGGLAGVSLEPVVADTARADRAEARLINVMEWLEEGVVLFDSDYKIRSMNTRFAQITGLSPEEISRIHTLNALIARLAGQTAQPEQFAERWREQARGDAGAREEIQLLRPVPRVLERAARPITDASGQRLGRVEIYRDLTGQRVFQSKLLQTEKLAALGQMVTGVAHELSNPLTSILGYAQRLFLKGGPGGEDSEVRQIFQEAERASAILRQLLMTARDSRPERRRVSLNEVVSRTLELQRFNLEAEKVRIQLDLDPALPSVLGDAGQLQQVLMNLVGNSRQAIEQGGRAGAIRISTARIGGSGALLEVADNGPGIPEGILSRIFDPFFTTKPAGIGTGLGLAIVLGIVREHGGQVRVSSPAGGGAIFSLEFPAVRAEEPRIQALPATGPGKRLELSPRPNPKGLAIRPSPVPSSLEGALQPSAVPSSPGRPRASSSLEFPRVLVVEDEPTVARLIADVLADEGMQVEVLLDGRSALDRVAAKDYDLVICDMKMPGLDGQAFYTHLVTTGNPLQNTFLFVTGDAIAAHTHEFLERNDVPYVAKPFRVEELTEKVHRVLGGASSHEPLPVRVSKTNAARK